MSHPHPAGPSYNNFPATTKATNSYHDHSYTQPTNTTLVSLLLRIVHRNIRSVNKDTNLKTTKSTIKGISTFVPNLKTNKFWKSLTEVDVRENLVVNEKPLQGNWALAHTQERLDALASLLCWPLSITLALLLPAATRIYSNCLPCNFLLLRFNTVDCIPNFGRDDSLSH